MTSIHSCLEKATGFVLAAAFVLVSASVFSDTFDSDGVEIFYTIQGEGEPVVLLHGFTQSQQRYVADGVIESLSQDYQVIAMDFRGHGESEKPHDPDLYGMQLVKDVANLLDQLDIEKTNILGYSMGGTVALYFAIDYQERVNKAIIGGMGWAGEGVNSYAIAEEIAESLEAGLGLGPLISAVSPLGQPPLPAERAAEISDQIMLSNDPLALAAVMRGGEKDLSIISEAQLDTLMLPVLFVVGENDGLKFWAAKAAAVINGADVVVLPGASHVSALSHEMFTLSIQSFLVTD